MIPDILLPTITRPTEPQIFPTVESTSATVMIPGGEERRTGVDKEQMIIIIVCVGLIVLFITVAAVYFLGIKRWREEKGINFVNFRKSQKRKGRVAFQVERELLVRLGALLIVLFMCSDLTFFETRPELDLELSKQVASEFIYTLQFFFRLQSSK